MKNMSGVYFTDCSRQSSFSADDEWEESDYGKGKHFHATRSSSRNIPLRPQRRVDDTNLDLPRHYMMKLQTAQSTEITSPTSDQADVFTTKPIQAEEANSVKTEVCFVFLCFSYIIFGKSDTMRSSQLKKMLNFFKLNMLSV